MKPHLLSKGFIYSLSYHYYPAQNRLLRLYLESGKPYERAKQLIPQVLKANKTESFIEAISRSVSLNDREKRMIHADIYLRVGLYEKAWEAIKSIPTTDNILFAMKEKILFHMRSVDHYLALLEEYRATSRLSEKEKHELLLYASLKSTWSNHERLAAIFEIEIYRISHKDIELVDNQKIFERLEQLSGVDQLFVFSQLLQKVEKDKDITTYKKLIDKAISLNNVSPGQFLFADSFIQDLDEADKAIKKKEYKRGFHKLIDAYEKGERSLILKDMLLKLLKVHTITPQEEQRVERLVFNDFIDIMSNEFLDVLSENEFYVSFYQYLNMEDLTHDKLHSFLHKVNQKPILRGKIVQSLVQVFYHYDASLPLDDKLFTLLEEKPINASNYLVVKGKFFIDQGKQEEELLSLIKNSQKQYQVFMKLVDYAYEKEKYGLSLSLANEALKLHSYDPFLLRKVTSIHHRMGNLREKVKYLKKLRRLLVGAFKTEYNIAQDEVILDEKLWTWNRKPDSIQGESGILHVHNKSLPEINGYTIRSKEIVQHQIELGLEPSVVTKLGWPVRPKVGSTEFEVIDGVRHYRLHNPNNKMKLNVVPLSEYFNAYADEFLLLLNKVRPKIVHAASNFQNALPALVVAKKVGIPTVYEVRGLWQDSTASKIPEFDDSERYCMQQKYEVHCCEIADRVVAIGESLAEHLITLGVDRHKIDIVPNGVDTKVFTPQEKNQELIKRYQLEDKIVFGFIGSVTKYEGLSDLFSAISLLKKEQPNIHFLLVGDGPALPRLRELADTLKISDIVSFVGRVPHTEVKDFYSVIDIFPFPRINAKVCRLVTPLKPFEVMAMGKLALVSNIPALHEMVIEGKTGLMFEAENVASLKECLQKAPHYTDLGIASREWVVKNRDWAILSKRYLEVYSKLEK
ncbi:glycosyltransferase [Metabacillus niabensis]|uniref:glycosyltransferase n=1 Tax=Metabacillus niabensis TaxID=324854 RepID=UPI001CFA5946|nr:glycosyltransferase family 4 protein [Metabacillus niabensis]